MLTVYGIETYEQAGLELPSEVATVLTVYGIETEVQLLLTEGFADSCNSAYRLRY